MENSDGLSSLGVDSINPRARDTARTLLDAYYLQDRREAHLIQGKPEKAARDGEQALGLMATAYEREFPKIEQSQARTAGKLFMRALFLQDEIENWTHLRASIDPLSPVLVSERAKCDGLDMDADPRWQTVKTYLRDVCARTGIDEAYADRQTEFWLRHGQGDDSWEQVALEAHELKARAMVGDAPTELLAALGEYFVEGVKRHDTWNHENRDREIAQLDDPVARYYQKIFQWRSAHR